jgi:predicted nucleotidyltransferase
MKNKGSSDITEKIRNLLSKDPGIVLAFLFGSYAAGNVTASSDADIALLFSTPPDFYKTSELTENLSASLKTEVDILVLNSASPVIKMQVLKHGILLINNDPGTYSDFFVDTVKRYDDLKFTRREIEDNILQGKIYA